MASLKAKKHGSSSTAVTLPEPSSLTWSLERVSSANAGRTQDGYMHVEQIALKRKLEVQWNYIPASVATTIIQILQWEYLDVTYYDYLRGSWETGTFYTGAFGVPVYTFQDNRKLVSNISVNLIEV